jgi:hypothetical protein
MNKQNVPHIAVQIFLPGHADHVTNVAVLPEFVKFIVFTFSEIVFSECPSRAVMCKSRPLTNFMELSPS